MLVQLQAIAVFLKRGVSSSDTPPHFFHLNSCLLDFFQEFSSTTSKVLSTNIPCINCTTMRNAIMRDDMSLVTLSHRVLNFHTPFRHGISSTYITTLYGCSIPFQSSVDKGLENISGSDHIRDHKGSQRRMCRSSKTEIDDAMMFHHQQLFSFYSCTMSYTPNSNSSVQERK